VPSKTGSVAKKFCEWPAVQLALLGKLGNIFYHRAEDGFSMDNRRTSHQLIDKKNHGVHDLN
jgi:hypothetical protein